LDRKKKIIQSKQQLERSGLAVTQFVHFDLFWLQMQPLPGRKGFDRR
jgi:hypothetical protein